MVKNSWNNVILVCGNHGDDHSHEMVLKQGPHSLFYSCPEYKSIFGDDHEGRSCNNRLTLVDYEKMLDALQDAATGNGIEDTDLTGFRYTSKGVDYRVLEHTGGKMKVLMLNRKAIAK